MSKKQQSKQLKTATEKQHPRKTYQFRLYPTRGQIKVLQDAVKRVDRAYDDFFRRVEEGQKPGFPRFKSRFRYASLTCKQYENSFDVLPGNKKHKGTLVLAKLGQIKMVMHRAIKGTPKTAIVKRTPTGKWYVSISVEMDREEVQSKRLPACTEAVGLDVGLKTFAYLSTGEAIPNPRFFRAEEAALARAQRKLCKAPKGSRERKKKRKVVARVHERISNRRANFIAEEAGRAVVRVNPAYTSQTCSACGHRQPMPLSVRVYDCPHCGLVIHRDHNGSLNILAEGLSACGRAGRVVPEAPGL